MKFELVELDEFSGAKCTVYSVWVDDSEDTLMDRFVAENKDAYRHEVNDITTRLLAIGAKYGAREQFFKPNEGRPGDDICALYDNPDSNLRLYCIRFESSLLILGGGGFKPKSIRALQEDPKLTEENYLLRQVSACVTKAMSQGSLTFDGFELAGVTTFDTDEL